MLAAIELTCDDFDGVVRVLQRLQQLQPMAKAPLGDLGRRLHVDECVDCQDLVRSIPDKSRRRRCATLSWPPA